MIDKANRLAPFYLVLFIRLIKRPVSLRFAFRSRGGKGSIFTTPQNVLDLFERKKVVSDISHLLTIVMRFKVNIE